MQHGQQQSDGFGIIGLIIDILVIAIIVMVGYYVYRNHVYWGWKSYETRYEKLKFKYPGNWQLSTSGTSDNCDMADLTAPDGFMVNVSSCGFGHPNSNGPLPVEYAEPVKFLGHAAYLDYYGTGFHANPQNPITGGMLSKSKTDVFDVFPTKNLKGGGWIMVSDYLVHEGQFYINNVKYDPNFQIAKQIIQSMHY